MFSAIRKRFTYANVAMTLALVFAMTGGAYAAKHYLITSTKQISPKVLKQLRGTNGKNGTNGTNGTNGAQGPVGGKGAAGTNGENGTTGKDGALGKSVVSTPLAGNKEPATKPCKGSGGNELEVEGSKIVHYACNGTPGAIHPGETLPPGASETGVWGLHVHTSGGVMERISFPIPLAAPLNRSHRYIVPEGVTGANEASGTGNLTVVEKEIKGLVVTKGTFMVGEEITGAGIPSGTTVTGVGATELFISEAATATATGVSLSAGIPAACAGGTVQSPKAAAGNLCLYTQLMSELELEAGTGFGYDWASGVIITFKPESSSGGLAVGTWAVTAE
jgi:Collagen triple helix repeat (20 copies)